MKNVLIRIAIWMGIGFVISFAWGFYFASANKAIPIGQTVYALARLTQPSAAVILYLNPALPLGLTWAAFANATTYALFGLILETIRRHQRSLRFSN